MDKHNRLTISVPEFESPDRKESKFELDINGETSRLRKVVRVMENRSHFYDCDIKYRLLISKIQSQLIALDKLLSFLFSLPYLHFNLASVDYQ